MLRLLGALLPTYLSAMRSRRDLVLENLALSQQLVTLAGRRHAHIRPAGRVFWILLRRSWNRWAARFTSQFPGGAEPVAPAQGVVTPVAGARRRVGRPRSS